ncbi:hypothetical protein [Rhodococcus jostii]|uniref:Uncharacterized protein n=1 Tax=Rhodococcus jostii TaxID=132919 RepID=A0A1H5DTI3_RHOJO|nr:hypothetical protein [Rhodococcus jostii]SED82157.1 hypothetical protein SAMN04490220_5672 [Rhodococcus jostii]
MEGLALASAVVEQLAPTAARGSRHQAGRHPAFVPVAAPSIHVRVAVTWVSIFPLVTLGMTVMALLGPTAAAWPTWLRALMLTGVVVPTAVYLVVPRVLALSVRWMTWRFRRNRPPYA